MKVAIITDTHWSSRKSSKIFQDYFEDFYRDIFFPTLEKENITTVIHMGDAFDNRKSIDIRGLEWTRRVVLEPLSKYNVHLIIGNHDVFFKNTNQLNSPELLLKEYENIKTYSNATEINIDGLNILLIPWICIDNEKMSFSAIKKSKAKVAMGHLELQGFRVNKQMIMESGLDSNIFKNFTKVFSGHYHSRSNKNNIYYLGNPYEIYWNDVDDPRGFVIFDTDTLEHQYIDNPYKMFNIINYEDNDYKSLDISQYENKIVKVVIKKKTDLKNFEKYIDKLYSGNIFDIKIIENFELNEECNFQSFENEDTISLLNRYIQESDMSLNKTTVQGIMHEIYKEACDLV